MSARRNRSASAIALLEETFQIVKALPLADWAVYYAATLPLVMYFLYFWADMANHAFAHERLLWGSALLGALFVIAKTGHALFAHRVLAHMTGEGTHRPRVLRVAMNQTIIQCTGLFLLPPALFFVVPFGWLYALYQNASALDDGRRTPRELGREAGKLAGVNRMQSNVALWLICPLTVPVAAAFHLVVLPIMRMTSPEWTDGLLTLYSLLLFVILIPLGPFAMIIAVNLGMSLVTIPQLLKVIFGIETAFSLTPSGVVNPTFFVIVSGLTYLCLDPLVKIAFALRCFYCDSLRTGKDLRIKIGRIAQRGFVLLAMATGILCSFGAHPQEATTPDSVAALDQAIEETLHDSRFAWRMPRQRPEPEESGIGRAIADIIEDVGLWIDKYTEAIRKWFDNLFNGPDRAQAGAGDVAGRVLRAAAVALLVALLGILLFIAWKTWRRTTVVEVIAAAARSKTPDLEDEGTTADALASAEWLQLAAELLARGEIRLAMRAYFFAGLARLGQLHLIRIAAHKSNREYVGELRRVEHARAELVSSFQTNVRVFESVWYGDHGMDDRNLKSFVHAMEGISACE